VIDWEEDLDLGPEPLYPVSLCHALFHWDGDEEDLQAAALGWLLQWRKRNPFLLEPKPHFKDPVSNLSVYEALANRMADWAWAEKGGADLEALHHILIKRHHLRLAITPVAPKGSPHVSKSPENHRHRQGGARPRVQDDTQRNGHAQILSGD